MSNRFYTPSEQFSDSTGHPLSGAKLFFYLTGTSTKQATYADSGLVTPNLNPIILDSAGRAGNIWLDPSVAYKMVLAPSTDTDPPTSPILTADPVLDPAVNAKAAIQICAGNPNGQLAGSQGAVGGTGASSAYDVTNKLFYVCTTTGTSSTAVWTQVAASLAGQLLRTGVISPTALSANTDNWNPTSLNAASVVRISASGAFNLTGIVAQPAGTILTLHNTGSNIITLKDSVTSTAANQFSLGGQDYPLVGGGSVDLWYDGAVSRWIISASHRLFASTAQAQAGTDVSTTMNSALTAAAIAALGPAVNGVLKNIQVFTASGAYTPTANAKKGIVFVTGGGGAGGGSSGDSGTAHNGIGGAGGAGATAIAFVTSLVSVSVTVGAGGTGASVGNGTAGGQSAFGAITANGGNLGTAGAGTVGGNAYGTSGAAQSTTAGATLSIPGPGGTNGMGGNGTPYSIGGGSFFGGGAGLANSNSQNGVAGTAYGAGGSGSYSGGTYSGTGGSGAPGVVVILEF